MDTNTLIKALKVAVRQVVKEELTEILREGLQSTLAEMKQPVNKTKIISQKPQQPPAKKKPLFEDNKFTRSPYFNTPLPPHFPPTTKHPDSHRNPSRFPPDRPPRSPARSPGSLPASYVTRSASPHQIGPGPIRAPPGPYSAANNSAPSRVSRQPLPS